MAYGSDQSGLNLYDEFLAHTGTDRLQKILARYELFKMVLDIPGDIVECGVFKGSGIYTLAKLRQIFAPNNDRRIVGFDFFDSQRDIAFERPIDQKVLDEHAPELSDRAVILKNLEIMNVSGVELVAGNVVDTTADYATHNPGFRISFLYLDVDNFEGTLAILKNFYPLVSPGGLVIFDEYGLRGFGESDAVAEYFKDKPAKLKVLPWANTPSAYIVKDRF